MARTRAAERARNGSRERLLRVVETGPRIEFQPVFELAGGRQTAAEALARFPDEPPARWFERATELGLGIELELACVRSALEHIDELPPDVLLSINVSPETAVTDEFAVLVLPVATRVIIELTEHAPVADYRELKERLDHLRVRGARIAVDDLGGGFASLRHVLELEPDIVKLDVSLTAAIETDTRCRAVTSALVDFATNVGATVVAEGIESQASLRLLRRLGAHEGQGFYLGVPAPLGALQ
jgi:EAL domain-containing protein (putative c-di-GMP-specific phosphodiesterase class I)